MKRNIHLQDITDGKLYRSDDLVKLGCDDCSGCSSCCSNMEALVLDPYDIHQLKTGLTKTFEELLTHAIEIGSVDGVLLPFMKTSGEQGHCSFLNEEGRCDIHHFRPGICRLFPLGRYYHDGTFSYVLQLGECEKPLKAKIKIKKWLGIGDLKQYETFSLKWHNFLLDIEKELPSLEEDERRILAMYLLRSFYQRDFGKDFYQEFDLALTKAKKDLNLD